MVIGIDATDYLKKDRDGNEKFITPVGIAVNIETHDFIDEYIHQNSSLQSAFGIPSYYRQLFHKSYTIKKILGIKKAIPYTDNLIDALQSHISDIYITYYVVSRHNLNEEKKRFLKMLGPPFSYITLWHFSRRGEIKNKEVHIDDFSMYNINAMYDLKNNLFQKKYAIDLKIYPHGDLCDPYVSIADMLLFLLEAKIHTQRKKLNPEDIQQVMDEYDFKVHVNYLDDSYKYVRNNLNIHFEDNKKKKVSLLYEWPKIKANFLVRPLIFVIPSKHTRQIRDTLDMRWGTYLVKYSLLIRSSYLYYDKTSEEYLPYVDDGDIFFYVGDDVIKYLKSRFTGMYDIKVYPMKKIKDLIKEQKYE